MGILFEHKTENYNSIEFKNYCEIREKKEKDYDPFDNDVHRFTLHHHPFNEWTPIGNYRTKEKFEENLLNPLWSVSLTRRYMKIEKKEDKVSVKFFLYYIARAAGKKFYKISTNVRYYTYNFKTNAIYEGGIANYHKKRNFSKRVRRITPSHQPLDSIAGCITQIFTDDTKPDNVIHLAEKSKEIISIFINAIPGIEKYNDSETLHNRLYKLYYDKQGVKLPNNWKTFIFQYPQPKLRQIRKNKMKYIDSLMDLYKLRGDKIRRVLHTVESFSPNLNAVYELFGEKFLLQQSDSFWKTLLEKGSSNPIPILNIKLPKSEIKNAFEIFKLVLDGQIESRTLNDHFYFYQSLNRFEKIKWTSTTVESFRNEHLDWTEKNQFYTCGDYTRIYDERFVEFVKDKIIDSNDETYYPVLLMNSKEYNEESFTQSNCVKTYVQRPGSVIISLRKNSIDSKERATIEFSMISVEKEIILNRVQTLGRFNKRLDESWDVPIALLDSRLRNIFKNFEFDLPKLEVKFGHTRFVANGTFVPPSEYLNVTKNKKGKETLYLNWDRATSINDFETQHMFI